METRTINQIKVYKLVLNNMYSPKIEMANIVCISTEKEKLIEFYNNEKADEVYTENGYDKAFKKGSILENYNPVGNINQESTFGHGINEEWIEQDILKTIDIPIIQ